MFAHKIILSKFVCFEIYLPNVFNKYLEYYFTQTQNKNAPEELLVEHGSHNQWKNVL